MLEHQKIVLRGVSDNRYLFRKELLKSINWLNDKDLKEFNRWVYDNFYQEQPEIISELIANGLYEK